jgi:hypothetical protein
MYGVEVECCVWESFLTLLFGALGRLKLWMFGALVAWYLFGSRQAAYSDQERFVVLDHGCNSLQHDLMQQPFRSVPR